MLWFLAALFWGLIHPVMILIPIALMVLVKDQGKMIAVIDHKRLENEQFAMEKGTITEQVPKTEEIIQLEKKLVTTRRLVNGLAGVLLIAGLVILFAGGL